MDTSRVEMFALATKGVEVWSGVEKEIRQSNSQLDAIPFEILDKNYYQNSMDFLNAQFAFIRSIILVIVAKGIFNIISVGLLERAGEMGVLLAVVVDKTLLVKGIPMPPAPGITRQFIVFLDIMPAHYVQALLLPTVATVLASLYLITKLLKKSIPELLRST